MELTLEKLADAIRSATEQDLPSLKKMVGPTPEEEQRAVQRIQQMDKLWGRAEKEKWGYDTTLWPHPFDSRIAQLEADQNEYENAYC